MSKKLVITADDFGISKEANDAILKSFQEGSLTSTCIMATGSAFEHAIEQTLPEFPEIGLGVHLNIIEGKTLQNPTRNSLLCDAYGTYNNGFVKLLAKSANKKFLDEVETDFRLQIEKVLNKAKVDHLNSHVHTHAIPNIFEITCKLAQEYGINYIRTQNEIPYFVPNLQKHLELRYPINLIKLELLNTFTQINRQTLKKYSVATNDYFVGVSYTSYMDEDAIKYGIAKVNEPNSLTEVILHPTTDESKKDNYNEFKSITNPDLKKYLEESDFELTNFRKLAAL
jgi:predicted glycoside hydrolase/deacetylase ChbG (UPF0249 family)